MARQVEGFCKLLLNFWQAEAQISICGRYRWMLHRPIQARNRDSAPTRVLVFVGLNPSRANETRDDPTLRRLQGFAEVWGYHHLVVLNLFARISASPSILSRCTEPVGSSNDQILRCWFERWKRQSTWDLWLGWGNGGSLMKRNESVLKMVSEASDPEENHRLPFVVGLTKAGHPRHPLYLPNGVRRYAWAVRFLNESHSTPLSNFPPPVWRTERSGAFLIS